MNQKTGAHVSELSSRVGFSLRKLNSWKVVCNRVSVLKSYILYLNQERWVHMFINSHVLFIMTLFIGNGNWYYDQVIVFSRLVIWSVIYSRLISEVICEWMNEWKRNLLRYLLMFQLLSHQNEKLQLFKTEPQKRFVHLWSNLHKHFQFFIFMKTCQKLM